MTAAFPSQLPDRKDVFFLSNYLPQGSIALHFLSDIEAGEMSIGELLNSWNGIPKSSHLLTPYLLFSPPPSPPDAFSNIYFTNAEGRPDKQFEFTS